MSKKVADFLQKFPLIEEELRRKRVVIALGGFGEEARASSYTGSEVYNTLSQHGFKLVKIDPSKENIINLVDRSKDIVFNCLHGSFGESGHLPAILDYLKIPYTFSGVYPSVITMDKLYFSGIIRKLGLNSPNDNIDKPNLRGLVKDDLIYKKIRGGGSIGMRITKSDILPKDYFAQEFISGGKILTLGILESQNQYYPLGLVEIKLNGKTFYDQDSKYLEGYTSYRPYSGKNESKIIKDAIKAFSFISVRGAARIDIVEKNGQSYILEINSVPGLYEGSNFVFSASLKNLTFYHLLVWLLHNSSYEKLA